MITPRCIDKSHWWHNEVVSFSVEDKRSSEMKNILDLSNKRIVFSLVGVLIMAAVIAAIRTTSIDEPTFTMDRPANYVTFDSITDNPNYGDERNFLTIKPVEDQENQSWTDQITVEEGKEYNVRIYVHNNAAANLGLAAKDVTCRVVLPGHTNNDEIEIKGYITSANSKPLEINDNATFLCPDENIKMAYVSGSASYTNNIFTGGIELSDQIVSDGAMLGYEALDGNIPGCTKYTGIVIFRVKATIK